jgi:cell surface protein SprA
LFNTIPLSTRTSNHCRYGFGEGLELGDSRAVFKNVLICVNSKKLKMFLHAESLQNETVLRDDQMVGFIRFGNDFTQNFYQIEIPLKVTVPSASSTSDCSPLSAQEVGLKKTKSICH